MVPDLVSRRTFVSGVTVAAVALAGCSDAESDTGTPTEAPGGGTPTDGETDDSAESEADVNIRAVHAATGTSNVDVYVGDDPLVEDLSFGTVGDYESVQAGDRELRITAAGDEGDVFYEDDLDARAGGVYSIVAYGETDTADGTPTEATPDADATGTPDGAVQDDGNGVQVTVLEDGPPEDDTSAADTPATTSATDTPTDGSATGTPTDGSATGTPEDGATSGEDGGQALVRAFHASPDAPDLDVGYADEEVAVLVDVEFGGASDYESFPTDARLVDVRPTGVTAVLAETDVELDVDESYTVFAMGYLEAESDAEYAFELVVVADGVTEADGSTGSRTETPSGAGTATDEETTEEETATEEPTATP